MSTETPTAWLLADFDRRHALLREMVTATGCRQHRPMIELLPQDDSSTGATWPEPHITDDLDALDAPDPADWVARPRTRETAA